MLWQQRRVDDHIIQPPSTPASLHLETPPPKHGSDVAVLSPMDSDFEALACKDVLRTIFEDLPLADLARAACVCRLWFLLASDRELQTRAFRSPWKLKEVVGNPSSAAFWRDNGLGRFAISHRLVRGDSVASLAVKYSVQVMDIKRLNNMMSDHGIYSRERLLIPVSNPDLLIGGTCYIELDAYAKREVAVLYLEGGPDPKVNCPNRASSDQGKRRIIDSLKRSMQVDDGTAQYYLSISDGDPRAALMEFSEDLKWERQAGLGQNGSTIKQLWKVFYDDKDRPNRYLLAKELISRPDAEDLEIIYGKVEENSEKGPSFFDRAAGIFSSVNRFMKAISR